MCKDVFVSHLNSFLLCTMEVCIFVGFFCFLTLLRDAFLGLLKVILQIGLFSLRTLQLWPHILIT